MTAKTSQKLADDLRAAGLEDLAKRAEADEFHDFLSERATPSMDLAEELVAADAREILTRHLSGEYDASLEESDEWAQSPEGQETFKIFLGSLMRGKQ